MDLSWTQPEREDGAPAFDNNGSPYAHYFLTAAPIQEGEGLRRAKRRSVVDLSTRLDASVDELIERTFGS